MCEYLTVTTESQDTCDNVTHQVGRQNPPSNPSQKTLGCCDGWPHSQFQRTASATEIHSAICEFKVPLRHRSAGRWMTFSRRLLWQAPVGSSNPVLAGLASLREGRTRYRMQPCCFRLPERKQHPLTQAARDSETTESFRRDWSGEATRTGTGDVARRGSGIRLAGIETL
jgi:hypothetical protein